MPLITVRVQSLSRQRPNMKYITQHNFITWYRFIKAEKRFSASFPPLLLPFLHLFQQSLSLIHPFVQSSDCLKQTRKGSGTMMALPARSKSWPYLFVFIYFWGLGSWYQTTWAERLKHNNHGFVPFIGSLIRFVQGFFFLLWQNLLNLTHTYHESNTTHPRYIANSNQLLSNFHHYSWWLGLYALVESNQKRGIY